MSNKLNERINYFTQLFFNLQSTSSLNEKIAYVSLIPNEYLDDWNCILDILTGKLKLGYTFVKALPVGLNANTVVDINSIYTIRQMYEILRKPLLQGNLSNENVYNHCSIFYYYYHFLEPLVNRKLRLGIGASLISKTNTYPMLGKKYEGKLLTSNHGYFVTEKLDGNRCIAYFETYQTNTDGITGTWKYQSRNGKALKVNFDMSNLPTDVIYDGEILSPEQVELSQNIFMKVQEGHIDKEQLTTAAIRSDFNKTSGLINSHDENKALVYNIFDIIDDTMPYYQRRKFIDSLEPTGDNVRILPCLISFTDARSLKYEINDILSVVCNNGGEGLMINVGNSLYQHKRTDALLKVKAVQTMDMIVHSTYEGTGKYKGDVGGIRCLCKLNDGKIVDVNVGSGLSDLQRRTWRDAPDLIVGKIVEIEYFSLSQSKELKGTDLYSMSFPRFKRVRYDKTTTSQY